MRAICVRYAASLDDPAATFVFAFLIVWSKIRWADRKMHAETIENSAISGSSLVMPSIVRDEVIRLSGLLKFGFLREVGAVLGL